MIQAKSSFLAVCGLIVGLLTAAAASAPARAIDIQSVTSPGGVTAWLVEDHTIPLVAMKFSFEGGAAGDPQDKSGIAHFLSGMLDEGAGDLDSQAFQTRLDELSIKLSFSATRDEFQGSLQTLTRTREEAFDLLKLALTAPRFDAEPLQRVRSQILLGIRQDNEDPSTIATNAWMRTAFPQHPYGRPTKGNEVTVQAINADDLKDLTKRLFARDGLKIAVVGDIDAETLKRLLDQTFGSLPAESGMPPVAEATPVEGPLVEVIERDVPQAVIRWGLNGIKRSDPEFIPAYVMAFILGDDGFGSRLMEEVREKRGLSYGVFMTLYPMDRAGLFYGGAATVNQRAGETIGVLYRELRRMAAEGPTEEELAQAKTYLTGSFPLRFDSNSKIAGQLLSIQRDDLGIDYVNRRNELINAVTLDEVKRLAKRLIDADELVFTVVGKPEGVKSVQRPG
jgi:zinc protease